MLALEDIKRRLDNYLPPQLDTKTERQAAVALLLRDNNGQTEILLIKRAEHDTDPWSGDLGFPGGGIEVTDPSPRAAAERETWEEIGLQLDESNYLGQSASLMGAYLSVHVSCFVYQVAVDAEFKLNGEVVSVFWIPLRTLLEPQRNRQMEFFYRGKKRKHPVIKLDEWSDRPLWGITYRLIDTFLNLFDLSFSYPERR